MVRRRMFIGFFISMLFFSCNKNVDIDFTNDWDEDVYYFAENLKDKHKDLFYKINETEFNDDITALREKTGELSTKEIIFELVKVVSKVGDSHTGIEWGNRFEFLPYNVEWVSDGVIVTAIDLNYQQYLGKKITGIGGTPMNTVIDSFRTIIAFENESNFKSQILSYFKVPEFFEYFGIVDSADTIKFNLENGTDIQLSSGTGDMVSIYDNISPPLYISNITDYYWFEEFDSDNLLYIQYNRAQERSDLSFQSFTNQIVGRINQNGNIEKVAIDLRLNGGGNSAIAKPLIEAMEQFVNDNRLSPADIYVIIGRRTFSSALLNAWEFKQTIDPVLIGEPTGGKPNHFGEVKNFRLPNSLLLVWYSSKYFELSPDDENTLEPDILIELRSEDLINGLDPILDKIKQE